MPAKSPYAPGPLHNIIYIADQADVSPKTVRRLIKSGDLIAHKIRNQWRISDEDWNLYLRTRRGANLADDGGHK